MTHDAWKARVLDLAIGALPPGEAREVTAHVAACPECAAELGSLEAAGAAVSSLPPLPAPERGEAVLLAAARQAAEARQRKAHRLPSWLWGAAVGGLAATAVVVVTLQLTVAPPRSRFDEGREALEGRQAPADLGRLAPAEPPPAAATPSIAEAPPAASPGARGGTGGRSAAGVGIGGGEAVQAEAELRVRRKELKGKAERTEAAGTPERLAAASAPRPEAGLAMNQAPLADRAAPAAKAASAPAAAPRPARSAQAVGPSAAAGSAGAAEADGAALAGAAAPAELAAPVPPPSPASPAPAPGPAEARDVPGCSGEARRLLFRDGGRLVRRVRSGVLAGVAYRAEETFLPDGRRGAWRVEARGQVLRSEAAGAAARLEALVPGLRLAADAGQAEAEPPRCE